MGYKLSSLLNLPFEENVEMYVFSIGETLWDGGLAELVHKNFDNIARAIGPNAIIVGALTEEFQGEVVDRYLGDRSEELKNLMPALLITDAHPDELNNESLRIVIPLTRSHDHYQSIDSFLSDLASFVRGDDDKLLRLLESAEGPAKTASEIVGVTIPIVPGVVAINLNNVIKVLKAWWIKKNRNSFGT